MSQEIQKVLIPQLKQDFHQRYNKPLNSNKFVAHNILTLNMSPPYYNLRYINICCCVHCIYFSISDLCGLIIDFHLHNKCPLITLTQVVRYCLLCWNDGRGGGPEGHNPIGLPLWEATESVTSLMFSEIITMAWTLKDKKELCAITLSDHWREWSLRGLRILPLKILWDKCSIYLITILIEETKRQMSPNWRCEIKTIQSRTSDKEGGWQHWRDNCATILRNCLKT